MGGLFGGAPKAPEPPPPPPPPAPMPDIDDEQVARARRRKLTAQQNRSGRQSTILSDVGEGAKLGG